MGSVEADPASFSLSEASDVKEVELIVAPHTSVAIAMIRFETGGLALFSGGCWRLAWFENGCFVRWVKAGEEQQWLYDSILLERKGEELRRLGIEERFRYQEEES